MKWLRRFFQTFAELKQKTRQEQTVKMLTDDPLTVELIERIAKAYDYHFEIVQPNGYVLRFEKKTEKVGLEQSAVW